MVGVDWPIKVLSVHKQKLLRVIKNWPLAIIIISISYVNMNMFARYDKFHQWLFKIYRKQTFADGCTDRQHENSIPSTSTVCGGTKKAFLKRGLFIGVQHGKEE